MLERPPFYTSCKYFNKITFIPSDMILFTIQPTLGAGFLSIKITWDSLSVKIFEIIQLQKSRNPVVFEA